MSPERQVLGNEKPCCFDVLLPELIDNILFQIDSPNALINFITTSRFIHRCYQNRRDHLIVRLLQNELGPVLTDAKFLTICPYAVPGTDRREEWLAYWDGIHTIAAVYVDMLGGRGRDGAGRDVVPSFTELTRLCRTHKDMSFLASTYVTVQLRSFGNEGPATAPPSRAEQLRVLRAFYRRQIVCNAWASAKRPSTYWLVHDMAAISNPSGRRGVRPGLCAAFKPWELWQIDHADQFLVRLCVALCLAAEEVAQPIDEAGFSDIFSHADLLVQYAREHPGIMDAALGALLSLPRLPSRTFQDTAPVYYGYAERYALPCLGLSWQAHLSVRLPGTAIHQGEQQQQQEISGGGVTTVNFVGHVADITPFGWVDMLGGRNLNRAGNAFIYSILSTPEPGGEEGEFARSRSFKLWKAAGFALWDQRRIEALKELDRLRSLRTGWLVS
ncbi:uncharacterized protein DNG_06288 [Cephalotrichum gorgonifer]|uniref:Uncharacterized protein n=1 Tax=Cephalotrichum gorgonifer TaxID=2041049 RepID=A0AAE8MZL9_9PEZI|nr:uncharacterized protein DNG_06288 [Cephalotrichum gorgonifer]